MNSAVQDLSRFKVPNGFRGRPGWYVQLWWLVQSTLFALSPQVLYGWRRMLLRMFGAKIGASVLVRPSVKITYPWKVKLGDYAWIGDDVVLYSLGNIEIGSHSVVSQRSYICTGSHSTERIAFDIFAKDIIVESEVWIAADVFVAPGLRVGRGAVVGARSSVFCDVPPMQVFVGSPAKSMGVRRNEKNLI